MTDNPRIVVRENNESELISQDFNFTPEELGIADVSGNLRNYRDRAWNAFNSLRIPSKRDPAWRRTDLKELQPARFHLGSLGGNKTIKSISKRLVSSSSHKMAGHIELTSTGSICHLSPEVSGQGVVFSTLAQAEQDHPDLVERVIGSIVKPEEDKFTALGSLAGDGIFLYVPRGVVISKPFYSLVVGDGNDLAYLTHLIVFLEEASSIIYIHDMQSTDSETNSIFHCGIAEVSVGASAKLQFVEVQSWGSKEWNITHERAVVHNDGKLDWIYCALGSHLTKSFIDLELKGTGASGTISGMVFANADQHLDHGTSQNHLAPNTTSDLLFKGVLTGRSRSVWQGNIYVAPEAAKSDGYQSNRKLILSEGARADSIPGLEILTDDVRCTHGATVGKIDPELIFYLASRGIPKEEAERLIVEGFIDTIVKKVPIVDIQNKIIQSIRNKLDSR